MINRRYLRIKVLQALYAYFRSPGKEMATDEKEMFNSIEKIYDLYLYLLLLLVELKYVAQRNMEKAKEKRLPTAEDLDPNTKFIDNLLINQIENNKQFQKQVANRKISWQNEPELIRKIFRNIKEGDEFREYMLDRENKFEEDKKFLLKIFQNYIAEFPLIEQHFEEKSIYWFDDLGLANVNVVKTLQKMNEGQTEHDKFLFDLYKDEEDDREFLKVLFRKTILYNEEYEEMIAEKAKNWEIERIAILDVLLMKMALCEFHHFQSVPVKVSLNEYIELAKYYSTPKSKVFINGILDKLANELKSKGKIVKTGRGLME